MRMPRWALWTQLALIAVRFAAAARCGKNLMYCPATGECISTRLMCDGRADCPSGQDESARYCDPSCGASVAFACAPKACIAVNQVCESPAFSDCQDSRDEEATLCDIGTATSIMTVEAYSTTTHAPGDAYCRSKPVSISPPLITSLPMVLNQTVVIVMCVTTGQPLLTATCKLEGQYPETDGYVVEVSNAICPDLVSASTPRLGDFSMEAVTEGNVINITKEVGYLTSLPSDLQLADISYSSRILQNLAAFYNRSIAMAQLLQQVSPLVATIVSNLMDVDREVIRDAHKDGMLATRIVESFDFILLKTAEAQARANLLQEITEDFPLFATKNLAYQVTVRPTLAGLALCILVNGTSIPTVVINDSSCSDCYQCSSGSLVAEITLSEQARKLPRAFALYTSDNLFPSGAAPGVPVLSAQISRDFPKMNLSGESDLVKVRQMVNQTAVTQGLQLVCGFWSFLKNDWDTMGCTTSREAFSGDVLCTCNHLTNFAVLMVPGGTVGDVHDTVLSYLSIIFLSISCFALVFVLITFFVYTKLRSSDTQRLTACLSLSLLCMNLLFIFGIEATGDDDSCAAIAVALHYFLLTSFMFMTAEAILHYLRLVKVLGAHVSYFVWKVLAISLGVPAVAVIGIRFGDPTLYGKGGQYCWVQPTLQIYGVIIPIAVAVAINSIVFGLIVRALRCRPQLRSSMSERKLATLQAKALAAIFVVLGITWIFGFLATIEGSSLAFQYMFSISNSLQGVLIFVFHNMKAPFIARSFKNTFTGTKSTVIASQTDMDRRRISALSVSTNVTSLAQGRRSVSASEFTVTV